MYALMLVAALVLFVETATANNACMHLFFSEKIDSKQIERSKSFLLKSSGLPLKLKSFVSSRVFSRYAESEVADAVFHYIVTANPGQHVLQQGEWIREMPRRHPGRTRMPPLKLQDGEFQAGLQFVDGNIFLLLKGIRGFRTDGRPLASGEKPEAPSTLFIKAIVGSLIASERLAHLYPNAGEMVLATLASVNANIGRVLGDKFGLAFNATIPKDEQTALMDDRAHAIARGADADRLTIMEPRDYFLRIGIREKK